jgi:hypothetical protein
MSITRQLAEALRPPRAGTAPFPDDLVLIDDGVSGGKARESAASLLCAYTDGWADVAIAWKPGGVSSYGLCIDDHPSGAGRTLVIDEAEAAAIHEAIATILAGAPWRVATQLDRAPCIYPTQCSKTGSTGARRNGDTNVKRMGEDDPEWFVQSVRRMPTGLSRSASMSTMAR